MKHQYEPRWRTATRPAKRPGVVAAVQVWVTERLSVEPPCRPPAAAHARGALWSPGILYVFTWRAVQRKRRRQRAKAKARRGWV